MSYVGAEINGTDRSIKGLGLAGTVSGEFTLSYGGEIYTVLYDSPIDGVILYKLERKEPTEPTVVSLTGVGNNKQNKSQGHVTVMQNATMGIAAMGLLAVAITAMAIGAFGGRPYMAALY